MTLLKFVIFTLSMHSVMCKPLDGGYGGGHMEPTKGPPPTQASYVKCADGSNALTGFNGQPQPCTVGNGYGSCPGGYVCMASAGTMGMCCAMGGSESTVAVTPDGNTAPTETLPTVGTEPTASPEPVTEPSTPMTEPEPETTTGGATEGSPPPPITEPIPDTTTGTATEETLPTEGVTENSPGPETPPSPSPMIIPGETTVGSETPAPDVSMPSASETPATPPAEPISPNGGYGGANSPSPTETPATPPAEPVSPAGGSYGNGVSPGSPSDASGNNGNSSAGLPTEELPNGNSMLSIMQALPDSVSFRKSSGPPVPTSGQFTPCTTNADCFHMREPSEWCRRPNDIFTWTDKSCFCASDDQMPSCIIERYDAITKETQWTYCAPTASFKCTV